MARTYVERCANAACGDKNYARRLSDPAQDGVPPEIVKSVPVGWEVCFCSWCKFVWRQPGGSELGRNAVALGFRIESGFIANSAVEIRDWRLNFETVARKKSGGREYRSWRRR